MDDDVEMRCRLFCGKIIINNKITNLVTCQSNFQFVKVNSMQKVKTSLEGAFIAFLGCFFDQKHVKYIIS